MLQLGNKITVGEPIYKFQNNHSVDFDGVDDFIQLGEPISYTQHTISTWVKITNSGSSKTIFDSRDSANDGIRLRTDSSENIIYRVNDSALTSTNSYVDEWVHIVGTYDGTTQKLYINGSLDQSATTSQTVSVTTNAKIGARNFDDRAVEFLGKIDELAIYDRALTAAEVTQIYRIKYGANLVQNGRFDELGSELVTNGDFATDSDWTKSSGATISDGKANIVGDGSTFVYINQSNIFTSSGSTYKVTADVVITSGLGLKFQDGATNENIGVATTSGSYTFYFTAGSNSTLVIGRRTGGTAFESSVDNVSVKQVDPNDRWTLPTGAAFADSKLVFTNASNSLYQSLQVFSEGTKIRVHFTVTNYSSGTIKPLLFGGSSSTGDTVISENGTFTQILTAGAGVNANFGFFLTSNTSLELSNVMVEEQKYVASNLKLNSGNYKSADPVIVSTKSVDFDGTDDYLDAGSGLDFNNTNFSVSCWFKTTDTVWRLVQTRNTGSVGTKAGWQISCHNGSNFFNTIIEDTSNNSINFSGVTVTNELDGNWHNLILTWDTSSGTAKLYIDGVIKDSVTNSSMINANLNSTDNLTFGASNSLQQFLNGKLDEIGIFNTTLSSDQVGELYNQGVPSNLLTSTAGLDGSLIGYWKMGDGTLDEAGLIADQTNATLGSEEVTDGDFSEGLDHWDSNQVEISNGVVSFDNSGDWIFQTNHTLTHGKIYQVATEGTGNLRFRHGFANAAAVRRPFTVGTNFYFFADSDTNRLQFYGSNPSSNATLSNVSVKEVNGNPALMENTPTIVTDAPLTKIRNYYRV